jgi:hypothetical protein
MKFMKKEKLVYKNGYLMNEKGKIVMPDYDVVYQFNNLEEEFQRALYLKAQPKAVAAPSMEGWEKVSERDVDVEDMFFAETPTLDKKIKESIALMDDIDAANKVDKLQAIAAEYPKVIEFINSKEIIVYDDREYRFDLAMLGNPLEFTVEKFRRVVSVIGGCDVE